MAASASNEPAFRLNGLEIQPVKVTFDGDATVEVTSRVSSPMMVGPVSVNKSDGSAITLSMEEAVDATGRATGIDAGDDVTIDASGNSSETFTFLLVGFNASS